ncbi:Hsp20 family chaperone [Oribacterium sp. oral taxon 078 str. F0263]|nr:Hsp20/alpha crystallin family protein [Oribacterium sp. oral taxon 078]ERL22467.1 Hsp20 family chaperone [Oribacterium sp. oral taxon 078 str. F0263]
MMYMPSIFGSDMFEDFFRDLDQGYAPKALYGKRAKNLMKTDIREDEKGYQLAIDLPGYRKDELKLELKDGYLTISAEKNEEKEQKDEKGRMIRQERYAGSVQRSFFVGEQLKEEDIKAKYEDGVLKLEIPKKEEEKKLPERRYIEIS